MGLRLTTKVQVSGWRFLLRRLEHAIVRRDTRMFDDPMAFYSRSASLGIVLALLIAGGALAMALFKPQGNLGSGDLFVDRATNQLYVQISGELYPVYNLTSARLVLGNPATPAVVKTSELDKIHKGHSIGIPGAPYATPVSSDPTSTWSLCDTDTNADSANPVVQSAVLAMPLSMDVDIDELKDDEALLVTYKGEAWIVNSAGRHDTDLSDRALTEAMGIATDADLSPISEGMFNALPDAGSWQLPPIPDAGLPNSLGLPDELVNGAVFKVGRVQGAEYFVVMPGGIARINANTATALRATESYGLVEPPELVPSLVSLVPEQNYASPLPDDPIKLVSRTDEPILCWSWERTSGDQAPKTMVLTGRHLPLPLSARSAGVSQISGDVTVYSDGGKFIQLQAPDSRYGESAYYVDPQGVRYGIPDANAATALGLSGAQKAPWEIVRLLVDGPVLSKDAALLEHETLPADPDPRKVAGGGS